MLTEKGSSDFLGLGWASCNSRRDRSKIQHIEYLVGNVHSIAFALENGNKYTDIVVCFENKETIRHGFTIKKKTIISNYSLSKKLQYKRKFIGVLISLLLL